MDSTSLMPFDNVIENNRRPRQSHNAHESTIMAKYIGRVMMGSIPKMLTIVSSFI